MKQGLFLIVPDQKDESALIDRFNLFCQKRIPDVLLFQPVCKENAQIRNFIKTVQSHGTAFIFENDIDSAVQLKADGVQMPYSENISDIREQIPEIYLGVVCTNRHEAMIAAEAGADYIGFQGDKANDLTLWWNELFVIPCINFLDLSCAQADFRAEILNG